jgi:hypothetical protein
VKNNSPSDNARKFIKKNVNKLKAEFKENIEVFLVVKNFDNGIEKTRFNINKVDDYVKIKYSDKLLRKKLC